VRPGLDLDRGAIRRGFARAARRYDAAAVLQREVARRMAERLDLVKAAPRRVLDLGCGTGADFPLLGARYREATLIGCDASPAMLGRARGRGSWLRRLMPLLARAPALVCADAQRLPLAAGSVGLAWSNLMLHWAADAGAVLREAHRVLETGGVLLFSTLGPDTLKELRAAFASADAAPHVHGFTDMHDLGDLLVAAGFAEPVMDMEMITLTYADLDALADDLRASGAVNAAAGRRRGLTRPALWRQVRSAYEQIRRDGRLPASFEVIYGSAWKPEPRVAADGRAIVRLDGLRRSGALQRP
jgi:malonyl-CoA O-methyltransferase